MTKQSPKLQESWEFWRLLRHPINNWVPRNDGEEVGFVATDLSVVQCIIILFKPHGHDDALIRFIVGPGEHAGS